MRRPSEIWPHASRPGSGRCRAGLPRVDQSRPIWWSCLAKRASVCTVGATTSLRSTFWPLAPPNPFPGFHRASLPASGLGAARTTTSCIGRARPRASRQGAASASVRWRAAGRETPSSTLHRQGTHRLCTTSDRRPGPVSPALALLEAWAVSRRGSLSWLPSVSLWEGLCSDSRKRASRRPLVTHARPRNCAPGARVAEQHGRDGRGGRGRLQLARRQAAQHGQKSPLRSEALRSLAPHATRRLSGASLSAGPAFCLHEREYRAAATRWHEASRSPAGVAVAEAHFGRSRLNLYAALQAPGHRGPLAHGGRRRLGQVPQGVSGW